MMYKGYEIEVHSEYTFKNGDTLTMYHVKKDGEYIAKNILSELRCKSLIQSLERL